MPNLSFEEFQENEQAWKEFEQQDPCAPVHEQQPPDLDKQMRREAVIRQHILNQISNGETPLEGLWHMPRPEKTFH
ncbi:MAG TPA: hypothetical protein VHF05_00220 [Candidatus Paceibacterota bacterium]|jgi:hypothetical protein|nr:hypothetical protein [Candidatus Paceibacterota bacterium]